MDELTVVITRVIASRSFYTSLSKPSMCHMEEVECKDFCMDNVASLASN